MRKHLAALAAATALLTAALAAPASAHEGNPDYRSVIDRVMPNVPGVTFRVLSYDSYFQLLDRHGHEVVIYGYEREPYARVRKDGTVQVNERSPALYLNQTYFPTAKLPSIANPMAPPKWKTVDDSGTFVWHDHRMHYQSTTAPPQVTDPSRKSKVFDYTIPLRIDGRKGAIDGTLYWVGPADTSKLPFILIGIAVVLVGGALVWWVRRRRGEEDGEHGGEVPSGGDEPAKEAW